MSIKVSINGALGRMGRAVYTLASKDSNFQVVDLIDKGTGEIDGCKVVSGMENNADCVIDFSTPAGTVEILRQCMEKKVAVVICTTGLIKEHDVLISEASKIIPVIKSSNMSVGVNMLFTLLENIKGSLDGFDIAISEVHHKEKKDKPSGTALSLNRIIGNKAEVSAFRMADIKGEHRVTFARDGEVLELTHRAYTRDIFASGALKAAQLLQGKGPGMHDFRQMLFNK